VCKMALATVVEELVGGDLPVRVVGYDGSAAGPEDAPATVRIKSPDALRRILTAPGELGFSRAYVAGDVDLDGDIFAVVQLSDLVPKVRLALPAMTALLRDLGGVRQLRPLPPPPEEVVLRGRRHSPARDRAAISHHYDVSNDFYRMVLGPSLTYSCAVFDTPDQSLEEAQANKHELICRKLGLTEDDRLLDVGCGWGSMLLHAARHHGVRGVGVTLSTRQAELARKRVAEAGLSDLVEIRVQDYRHIDDEPFDAISSVGMFEHVGQARLAEYFGKLCSLLRPGGRLLNHGITRPAGQRAQLARRGFVNRYVFPDGELVEVGEVVSRMGRAGLEVRHSESLREHYALTLRHWVDNLERHWDAAVAESSDGRARVWRLYMAGSANSFEGAHTQIHQVLAVRPTRDGASHVPLRPHFE